MRVPRGVHRRHAARGAAAQPAFEGIVAAGVDNNQVDPVSGIAHLLGDEVDRHRFDAHCGFRGDVGIHWYEIVLPLHLQPCPA
jgi:hypothetical protein